jgi:hypothetical protein
MKLYQLPVPNIRIADTEIFMKQYNLTQILQSVLPSQTCVPYFHIANDKRDFGASNTYLMNTLKTSIVPRYMVIKVSDFWLKPEYDPLLSDECSNRITKMFLQINGQADVMSSRSEQDLYQCTKKNMIKIYDDTHFKGRVIRTPNVAMRNGLVCQVPQIFQSEDSIFTKSALGTTLVLEFGSDIALNNLSASTNCALNLDLTLVCADVKPARVEVSFIYEYNLLITDNTSKQDSEFINQTQYSEAQQLFTMRVKEGMLYVNSSKLRGGSIFTSAVSGAKSLFQKILPIARRAFDYYSKNQNGINGAVNAVGNVVNSKSLADVINNGSSAINQISALPR